MLKMGLGAVAMIAAASFYTTRPSGDPGDLPHVATFKTQCQRAMNSSNGKVFCRCVAARSLPAMKTPEEHALAAGIISAISKTASKSQTAGMDDKTAKAMLQDRFDRLSNDYHMRISIPRKAAVLQSVTGGLKACAPELARKAV